MKQKKSQQLDVPWDDALETRLLAKVIVLENGCWVWQGYRDGAGYGQVKYRGRAHWAHRVSFALYKGPIPAGLTVHHTCYETGCINPEHLDLLTRSENSKERHERHAGNQDEECAPSAA